MDIQPQTKAMKGKIHLAGYDPPNESDSFGYWGETTCGSESENVTQYESEVTCKNCLRLINKSKSNDISSNNVDQQKP
jgi:hypothetical protein